MTDSAANVARVEHRDLLSALFEEGVAAVGPGPLTEAAIAGLPLHTGQRVHVFALGKASRAMATAACTRLHRSLARVMGGLVVTPVSDDASAIPPLDVIAGDHPHPGDRSLAAARSLGECAAGLTGDDVALVLLSGGTSSLVAAPVNGVAPADLRHLFALVDRAGLPIGEMNVVRKRLTRWGAGRLALALAPARTHVLAMSDVAGDDLADIGSGPCAPDRCTVADVVGLLRAAGLLERVPPAVRHYLEAVRRGDIPETPKPAHRAFARVTSAVIGTNRLAVDAIIAAGAARGRSLERADRTLAGDAAACGAEIAQLLLSMARDGVRGGIVWGGETIVVRQGADAVAADGAGGTSLGGRCQELALAAARVLAGAGDAGRRVTLLAAGTDGRDGPTDAAGAFADATVWPAIVAAGVDPARALRQHDSYHALHAAGALLRRGPTGTNVMDVVIGLVE